MGFITRNGICSFSGGIIKVGKNSAAKMKKQIRLDVSTFADAGSVFSRSRKECPTMAFRIILILWPPQYIWIPSQTIDVTIRLRTGQKPPRIPQDLLMVSFMTLSRID